MSFREILEHWNSKKIMVHYVGTYGSGRTKDIIEKRKINEQDLMLAIDNYATIFHDKDYYFKYKWSLAEFVGNIQGNYIKFLPDGEHYINYAEWKERQPKIQKPIRMEELQVSDNEMKELNDIAAKLIERYKTMSYAKYLLTDHWLRFKTAVLKHAQHNCQICGANQTELHVHHKSYENRGCETFNDVVVLCSSCHKKFHGKDE